MQKFAILSDDAAGDIKKYSASSCIETYQYGTSDVRSVVIHRNHICGVQIWRVAKLKYESSSLLSIHIILFTRPIPYTFHQTYP